MAKFHSARQDEDVRSGDRAPVTVHPAPEGQYRAIFEATSDGLVVNDLETGVVLEANPAMCRMHGYERMDGMHPSQFIHPNSHRLFASFVEAVQRGQEFRTRAQDIRRDGSILDVEVLGRRISYNGRPAMLGVVRDATEQVVMYQLLEDRVIERTREIERRRQVAEALGDLLAVLNSGRTLDQILDYVVNQACQLLGSHAAAIYTPDGNNTLTVRSAIGLNEAYKARRIPIGMMATGLAFAMRRPIANTNVTPLPPEERDLSRGLELDERASYSRVIYLPVSLMALEHERAPFVGAHAAGYRALLAMPLLVKDETYGTLTLYYREPREFLDEEVALASAFANQAALAIENAELYAREEQRRHEMERRREVAEGLRDLLATINSGRTLDEILDVVVSQTSRVLGSDASAIYLPLVDGGEEYFGARASNGLDADYAALRIPFDWSATGLAFNLRRPVSTGDVVASLEGRDTVGPDWETEERGSHLKILRMPRREVVPGDGWQHLLYRQGAFSAGYRSLLAIPLSVPVETYGTLTLFYRESRDFSDEEVALASAFADQAALAIENARLREQAEQAATAEERQRLARELHDAVTQTLFSTSLIAEVIPDLWQRNQDEGMRRLTQLQRLTRGALAEMRSLLVELRPGALTELPFATLLRQLAEAMAGRSHVALSVTTEGEPSSTLPPEVQVALYRLAQEALNNVAKHSGATESTIHLSYRPDGAVRLEIADNGRGFDPATVPAGHLGLGIMRERAEALGACLAITSRPGDGTRVQVDWSVDG